jgi:hypothetical protein
MKLLVVDHDPPSSSWDQLDPAPTTAPLPSDPGVAAFGASLTAITLNSLGLGYGLREQLPATLVPWLAEALFLSFALKLLVDTQRMRASAGLNVEPQEALPWRKFRT